MQVTDTKERHQEIINDCIEALCDGVIADVVNSWTTEEEREIGINKNIIQYFENLLRKGERMTKDEMIFQQGRLSGLKEARNLPFLETGNSDCLLTLERRIANLETKLSGTTVHDCDKLSERFQEWFIDTPTTFDEVYNWLKQQEGEK